MNFLDLAGEKKGQPHIIGVRPEDIHLTASAAGSADSLRIPVRIERTEFQGPLLRVECQLIDCSNTLRLDIPIHQITTGNLTPGTETCVWIEHGRMQHFRQEEAV